MDGDAMDDFVSFSGNRIFVTHVDYYNTGIMHAYTRGPITDIFLLEMGGSAKDHRASVCAIESSIKLI
jgi:hypothetical protein